MGLLLPALAQDVALSQKPQTASAASPAISSPQLSPKAAYDDAMHPFEVTRNSIINWSGAEVSALKVSIDRARAACQARDPHAFSGPDLIDFARLCGLGQEWGTVVLATTLYIDSPAAWKPLLTEAHAARVDADLRLHSELDAIRDTHTMLTAVPFSPLVAEACDEAIDYMRFSTPEDALAIAAQRQPFVLAELKQRATPPAAQPSVSQAVLTQDQGTQPATTAQNGAMAPAGARFSIHELYGQALTLASLQQLIDQPALAQGTVLQLDSLLPPVLSADDALPIAESRLRYSLLGKPLPDLALKSSLSMPKETIPAIPAVNTMTVLLLFPDWCAQCITAMSGIPETVFRIAGHEAYYYGLLAETVPERKPDPPMDIQQLAASFSPAFAAALLAEKPVITIPPSTLEQFAAKDFPFLVLTDPKGIVRVVQPVDADDLASGGKVDAAVVLVGQHWPGSAPKPPHPANAIGSSGTR